MGMEFKEMLKSADKLTEENNLNFSQEGVY